MENTGENNSGENHTDGSTSSNSAYKRMKPASQEQGDTALEVHVDNNIEKAMKVLKRKLIKEGLFKELKARRYYEKPSERRKRKLKESMKKIRKEEARRRKSQTLF